MSYSKRKFFNTTNTEDMLFKKMANNFTIMATIKIKVRNEDLNDFEQIRRMLLKETILMELKRTY